MSVLPKQPISISDLNMCLRVTFRIIISVLTCQLINKFNITHVNITHIGCYVSHFSSGSSEQTLTNSMVGEQGAK